MRMSLRECAGSALILLAALAQAAPCTLHPVAVNPVAPGRHDAFAAVGHTLRVEFRNDTGQDDVRVFPESPLTIRHLRSRRSCTIQGGVWDRDSVFLSNDERVLVVLEFSGESNHLISYSTATCRKRGDLDVSGGRWAVTPSGIVVGSHCTARDLESCQEKHTVPLKKLCSPGGEAHER